MLIIATIGCLFIVSLLFLGYVYVKAFVGRGIFHIGRSIKVFFVAGGICVPAAGAICTYLDYSNLEEKQKRETDNSGESGLAGSSESSDKGDL